MKWLRPPALALLAALAFAAPAVAADMPARDGCETPAPADLRAYLDARAILLQLRATFDVIRRDDIPAILADDLRQVEDCGPDANVADKLWRDLLAEGSYFMVSIRYLAETGGAAWPEDRPADVYLKDAIVELDGLQAALQDAVASRTDPLDVLRLADRIFSWTEGSRDIAMPLDHFSDRDALVEAALSSALQPASTEDASSAQVRS
jgi:hypothetical protein